MTTQATQISQEITFGFDELFFSRTDQAGIIQFGNSVFQRVSIYEWDELLGKPHKIVRHPDTPRAVFFLLWEHLKRDAPVGAYVKNRAKDGRYYWVFALASPIPGGHLSVRLRPSTKLFDAVRSLYAEAVVWEREEQLPPDASAARIAERLAAFGYDDYGTFMTEAVGEELAARDRHMGGAPMPALTQLKNLSEQSKNGLQTASSISDMYVRNEHVPLNFRVLAAQLGAAGQAIGEIATNYGALSDEMRLVLEHFLSKAADVRRTLQEGYFLSAIARLQREVADIFARESLGDVGAQATEAALLRAQYQDYASRADAGLAKISSTTRSFQELCGDMRRLASGLEVTRVMSVVECARHPTSHHRTAEMLQELEHFQKQVSAALKQIELHNNAIHEGVRRARAAADERSIRPVQAA